MIFLEKSELLFSKCPTKIILLPHLNGEPVNPLEKKNVNHPPPPFISHAPDVFLSFQFPLLKKTDNAQLCSLLVKLKQYLVIILRTYRK